jgi:enamine deaminase RidA (YjgF/YER057c/UK114 family)
MEGAMTPHEAINPASLAPPLGFSHALAAAPGRLVFLGGQTGHAADGSLPGSLTEQFESACLNVVAALEAAGGKPEHLVQILIFTTDPAGYRASLEPIGSLWRRHFGRHYPAVAWFAVSELFDPDAVIELVCTAVVPE